jgi:exodeoxyribonuclease-3
MTRVKPLQVLYGIQNPKHDDEGRVLTAEFREFYLVCAYVPSSGEGLKWMDY